MAKKLGVPILGKMISYSAVGVEPSEMVKTKKNSNKDFYISNLINK
jgi:hypothetical protein